MRAAITSSSDRAVIIAQSGALIVAFTLFSHPARAQDPGSHEPTTRGLAVWFAAEAMRLHADTLGAADGLVGAIGMGAGFSETLFAGVGVGVGGGGSGLLGYFDVFVRFYSPHFRALHPYAEIAFSSNGREMTDDRNALGSGITLGAGTELFLRRGRSIIIGFRHWRGRIDQIVPDGPDMDVSANASRLMVGVVLRSPR